jgi:hypothetical protein
MKGIFISYRRQDSQSAAGRLADHLRDAMAGVPIFRDVETIEPGVDFVEAIGRALQSCGVLLAVIGPRWSSATDAAGKRRLDNPDDYTRLEIATALQRPDVRVIPVLVEGAVMPAGEELPDDLKALSRRNAIELTDKRWEFDVSTLGETLRKALDIDPAPKPPPQPKPAPEPVKPKMAAWKKWALGLGIPLFIIGAYVSEQEPPEPVPYNLPAPVYNNPQPAAPVQGPLTGIWQDGEGGQYKLLQQGIQLAMQGSSPHGAVIGTGQINGNQIGMNYTINGVPYQAALLVSPDGLRMSGQYRSPANGDAGVVGLVRVQ